MIIAIFLPPIRMAALHNYVSVMQCTNFVSFALIFVREPFQETGITAPP